MVIFGGVSSIDIFTNSAATNDVEVWDLASKQWYRPSITAAAGSTIPLPQKFVPCVGFPNTAGKMFVLMANTTDQANVAKNIAVLDLIQGNWQEITTLVGQLSSVLHAMRNDENQLIVMDSNVKFSFSSNSHPRLHCVSTLKSIYTTKYYIDTDGFVSPPPDFRIGVTLTAVNDVLYRYAGRAVDSQGNQAQAIDNLLYSLNSKTLLWTPRANGPPLAYHTACYLSKFDVIAVFGGQSTDFQAQDVLITYSVSQGVWNQIVQPVSNKPSARLGHTAVCKADQMIIFGGGIISSNGTILSDDSLWLLTATSATSFTWSQPATNGMSPGARLGHSAVLSESLMIVFGGIGSPVVGDTTVYMLDTITWTWNFVSSSPMETQTSAPNTSVSTSIPNPGASPSEASSHPSASKIITAAVSGFIGFVFIAIVFFIAYYYYHRRKNRKLQSDNDEMSKIDSTLDGNSNDTSLPPRYREVILTSPVTVH
ncbi:10832_t:CDS:2 [Paraglomus brasilianum]|uniref:10832_t:CDS:1 n=1 Tax=Paraglomus brasilianum TaxID=144538 RepID=A0A9N9AC90_9GLOM|nr:10832_t:CDS:2 [Paraglomus brasilianum]